MPSKTLFEIPIYAMTEKEFAKRWGRIKSKLSHLCDGFEDEKTKMLVLGLKHPRDVWKYNQIIGVIVISVTRSDVYFDIYKSTDTRFYADSGTKHFITYMPMRPHFYAYKMKDKKLHDEIRTRLKQIEKNYIRESMFVDYHSFNNIFDAVNIRRIMDSCE